MPQIDKCFVVHRKSVLKLELARDSIRILFGKKTSVVMVTAITGWSPNEIDRVKEINCKHNNVSI